jgi:hypothetical protein
MWNDVFVYFQGLVRQPVGWLFMVWRTYNWDCTLWNCGIDNRELSSGLLQLKQKKLKYDSDKNTPLEIFWKEHQYISVVYITFEKHTFRQLLHHCKGLKPFWIRDTTQTVQHIFSPSKPTIQYIIVVRITTVMVFLKDSILATDRDAFYQTKTYTISSNGGHLIKIYGKEPEVVITHVPLSDAKRYKLRVCILVWK